MKVEGRAYPLGQDEKRPCAGFPVGNNAELRAEVRLDQTSKPIYLEGIKSG